VRSFANPGPMRDVLNFVRRVAACEATTILLEGENGTGKDLVGQNPAYIRASGKPSRLSPSLRRDSRNSRESELLPYEKGAFTDGARKSEGFRTEADKGRYFWMRSGKFPYAPGQVIASTRRSDLFGGWGGLKDIKLDLRVVAAPIRTCRKR